MNVEVVRWHAQADRSTGPYPRLVLEHGRTWNDGRTAKDPGYEGLYDVYYEEAPGSAEPLRLGSVKILQRGRRAPDLSGRLASLPEDCCSLGQTIDYYRALEQLGESVGSGILRALRDVTADETIARGFASEPGFRTSLLRFSEAARIYHHRPLRLHREAPPAGPISFRFCTKLTGFDDPHEVDLAFFPEPKKLGRMMALVGKNGTGKTQLLARLGAALWGLGREDERILPERPPIGRVIAVSYSALDAFERPPHRLPGIAERPAFDTYRYCGFRGPDDALRPELLFDGLAEDLAEIRRWGRRERWEEMLDEVRLLEGEPDLAAALAEGDAAFVAATKSLGAGEKTALSVLTRLLATLRNGAFMLFDEPELNLHPALLSSVLRVIHEWLEDHDGHGVVATHSPIVLQEIPGRSVCILDRVGKIPAARAYEAESFGQNLSEIVGEVFGLDERDKNYASALRELVDDERMSADEIESAFGRPLSLNARMALRHLARRGGGDAKS